MSVVGIALRGFGKALPKLIKKTLDAIPKGPLSKKFKTRREALKDSNRKAKKVFTTQAVVAVPLLAAVSTKGNKKTNPRTRRAMKK